MTVRRLKSMVKLKNEFSSIYGHSFGMGADSILVLKSDILMVPLPATHQGDFSGVIK